MRSWLQLVLVTMTVGGGFAGIAATCRPLLSSQAQSPSVAWIYLAFVLLYLFVLATGLLIVRNPRRTWPLAIALAIQIPVVSSSLVTYQFAAGFDLLVGVIGSRLFGSFNVGSQWQLNLAQPAPAGFGVNIIPILLLVAMNWTWTRKS